MKLIESTNKLQPYIFDIKRGSLDDGPGIRTTVFFKGCPLRCVWCHNPESYLPMKQIALLKDKCIGCGLCISGCKNKAIKVDTKAEIDRNLCVSCGLCTNKCPTKALKEVGKSYTIEELTELLLKDEIYYRTSNGGVTFSGGEPLLHIDCIHEVAKQLHKHSISCAVQTSGYFEYSSFQKKVLPWIDIVYFDLKIWNTDNHKRYTGVNNELILENFLQIIKEQKVKVIVRTPKIPGITDVDDNIENINRFLEIHHMPPTIELLYNSGGQLKKEQFL